MKLEDNVQKLVKIERHVRALETIIQQTGSMNDEELKAAWPRILKASRALEIHGQALACCDTTPGISILMFEEDVPSLCKRFWRGLGKVQARVKKAAAYFRMNSRQQEAVSALK